MLHARDRKQFSLYSWVFRCHSTLKQELRSLLITLLILSSLSSASTQRSHQFVCQTVCNKFIYYQRHKFAACDSSVASVQVKILRVFLPELSTFLQHKTVIHSKSHSLLHLAWGKNASTSQGDIYMYQNLCP